MSGSLRASHAEVDGRVRDDRRWTRPRSDYCGRGRRRASARNGRGAHRAPGDRRAGQERRAQRTGFAAVDRADAEGRPGRDGGDRRGRRGQRGTACRRDSRDVASRAPGETPEVPRHDCRGGPRTDAVIGAILPGSTIGVLGGGQLGRMFAMAARRLGYRVHTLAPEHDTPTGQISDVEIVAPYDDLDAVRRFAQGVSVVTFEFENVAAGAASTAEAHTVVRPSGEALAVAQHRLREKTFLAKHGLPVAPFAAIRSDADIPAAIAKVGCPAILKTATFGYDGKGQVAITRAEDVARAWETLGRRESILEAFVDLACEISVVGARAVDGTWTAYGAVENVHRHHILDVSTFPASVPAALAKLAADAAHTVMEALAYVGVLCMEFFVTRDGRLLVNEIAPRPHNSGHLTIEACSTSQFEQQVRAVCGLDLGSVDMLRPAAMANLLGDLWERGEPDWSAALSFPAVKLHLYGKTSARPGRKMGHLTALAPTPSEARDVVIRAREALTT